MNATMFLIAILFLCINCTEGRNPFSSFIDETVTGGHVFKERIAGVRRPDLTRQSRVSPEINHEVVFAIKQKNLEELTAILHDVSDPKSINYGKHKTRQEVSDLTANLESRDAVVSYITSVGATIVSETLSGEFVIANGPIRLWEEMFHTEFFMFHQTQDVDHIQKLVRSEHYSIPAQLHLHVECVFNTIQMPLQSFGGPMISPVPIPDIDNRNNKKRSEGTAFESNRITPDKLKVYYNISSNVQGSSLSTQAIYASIEQFFSPADLKVFQEVYQPPAQAVLKIIGEHSSDDQCVKDANSCGEGNLDLQYMMSTSRVSPTTWWYTGLQWSDWLVTVANTRNPPLVFSISYGQEEQTLSSSELDAFNTQAIKLGVMGVTIVAASGDDGANSRNVRTNRGGTCGYVAIFPASSPYVTTVGATQVHGKLGLEKTTSGIFNNGEITCSSNTMGTITTGGGFSNYYSRAKPAFQNDAINNYLQKLQGTNKDPITGYNTQGRGYPDIAAAGLDYTVYIGGNRFAISGTSASSPVIAGLFSNVNAKRLAAGKGALGWINPTLYQTYKQFTNDITEGHNLCVVGPVCCAEGFFAAEGWDPTTGLGSVNYGKMESTLMALGNDANQAFSFAPTMNPTAFPTGPTNMPTPGPTVAPSISIGSIALIAGNGNNGYSGDSGPAVLASLASPLDIAIGASGSIYIADTGNHRVRMIRNGIITTVAGNGVQDYSGDRGQATAASLNSPVGVALDVTENLYIADSFNNVIRMVLKSTGIITTIIGNGFFGFGGDNSIASSMSVLLGRPLGIFFTASGNLFILDSGNHRIRIVMKDTGIISTVIGNGIRSYGGDGGKALSASIDVPLGIAEDAVGSIYIADSFNHRVRMIRNGIITTVAGNGVQDYTGDKGQATAASIDTPSGVALDVSGNIFIADSGNNRIRMVLKSTGIITTVATQVGPARIYLDGSSKVFFADESNQVRAMSGSSDGSNPSLSPSSLRAVSGSSKFKTSSLVMITIIGLVFTL